MSTSGGLISAAKEARTADDAKAKLNEHKIKRTASLKRLSETQDGKTVLFSATVHKLGQIDPIEQTFFCEVGVHLFWYEPELVAEHPEGKKQLVYLDPNGKHKDKMLVPALAYENGVSITRVKSLPPELRGEFPKGVVHWEERVYGTFSEFFELEHFPYDVQSLTMTLRINSKADSERGRCVHDVWRYGVGEGKEFAHSRSLGSAVSLKETVAVAEWRLYTPTTNIVGSKNEMYNVHVIARRRHVYYSLNIMAMMGCVCSLGLTAYVVPVGDFADRSSILLTILLTAVAFKFIVAGDLPKVPYSTFLDIYINICFTFLMVILLQNAVLAVPKRAESIMEGEKSIEALLFGSDSDGETETAGSGEAGRRLVSRNSGGSEYEPSEEAVQLDIWSAYIILVGWICANVYVALSAYSFCSRVKAFLGEEINAQAIAQGTKMIYDGKEVEVPMWKGVFTLLKETLFGVCMPAATAYEPLVEEEAPAAAPAEAAPEETKKLDA